MADIGNGSGASSTPMTEEQSTDLITQIRTLLEYKWSILGVALLTVLITAFVVFSMEPTYRATTTLLIEPKQEQVLDMQEIYNPGAGSSEYYSTQYEVLRSRDLAVKAVQRIDWKQYPDFLPPAEEEDREIRSWLRKIGQWLPFLDQEALPGAELETDEEDTRQRRLVGTFMEATKIEPVARTQLVKVHFISKHPALSQRAANVLGEVYIESGFEAKLEATKRANEWLNSRLGNIKGQLAESEAELQDFREDQDLVNIRGGRGVLEDELTDNMQRLRDARRNRTELQNTYEKIQQANGSIELLQEIPVLLNSKLVQSTKNSYLQAKENLEERRSRYGPKHPKIISAKARFEEAEDAFRKQLRNAADGIRAEYQIAAQNARSLSAVVQRTREQIKRLDRKEYQMQVLEREAETSRELYDSVLTRFKETDAAGDYQTLRARVVDSAILPKTSYEPRKKRSLVLATFFGLFLGVVLSLTRERLDDSIRSGEELELLFGLAVLASLPQTGRIKKGAQLSQIATEEPKSAFAEGMRTVRTGVVLSDLDRKCNRLLVTSTIPLEGKSSIACNLALTFGQMERVLLVEGDLRRPTLAKYLGVDAKGRGLTELLSGEATREDAIHHIAENVDLLPISDPPPNPGELLSSQRFAELMHTLSTAYDRVIIDSAPCQPISDTLLLARQADAAIFVVQYDSTSRRLINGSLKRLRQAKLPILGAVLNHVDPKRAHRYKDSYYYNYGYYAG